ncbi:MAG: hypothetical protein JWR19_2214 [Pedosphaera sp.]|nr:hypothetical protein [Pedosphaera sp.]
MRAASRRYETKAVNGLGSADRESAVSQIGNQQCGEGVCNGLRSAGCQPAIQPTASRRYGGEPGAESLPRLDIFQSGKSQKA